MVTRRDLRAERDFYSPMTGDKSSTYGSQVRSRLEDLKNVKGTRAPAIEAAFVKLLKTKDPFTQIDEKKSYAPDEEDGLMGALEGLGDGGGVAEAVEEFIEPFTGGGSGGSTSPNDRRLQRQAESRAASQANTGTGRDGTFGLGTYGKGVPSNPPDGSFNITTVKPKTPEQKTSEKPKYGQGGLKLGTTTQRQGNTIRDGVEGSWGGPAVNVSGHYSDNREKQKNLRMAQAQAKRVSPEVKATGIPTGLNLKAGSFGISQAGRDQAAINKGIAAAVKTGIPNQTAVQGGAMSQAARDQAAINKGIKAAQSTGIPSGDALKAGSFGISKAGAEQAAKNRAQAKAKAQAAKTSSVSTTTKQGKPRTAAQMSAAKRISSGKSISQSKAANRASMKANAAARNASFQAQKKAGTHSTASRTAAGQRARNKAAAKARAKAAAKRRNKSKKSKKCDITIKYDISLLTNNNLRHDELADVAYFVRALNEVEL